MKQLVITLITTIVVSVGVVLGGTASQAHAEEVVFTLPSHVVDVTFRQHSCTGAGVIYTSAGYHSPRVKWRVYWPKSDGKYVNQLETSIGGNYPATRHYWQHNPTRDHRGKKVSGTVTVKAIPIAGYKWDVDGPVIRRFTFRPRSC